MASVYIYILENMKIFFIGQSLYLSLSLMFSLIFLSLALQLRSLPLLFLFKITNNLDLLG